MKILIIESDEKVANRLKRLLEKRRILVDLVFEGNTAIARIDTYREEYQVIVIDSHIHGKNGLKTSAEMRLIGIKTPILMLISRDDPYDKALISECGGSDFLIKPFSIEELHAKIESLWRDSAKGRTVLKAGNLELHLNEKKAYASGEEIPLTAKELNTLKYLMQHPNQVLSRDQILHYIWGFDFKSSSNVVDVHIKNLRKKLPDRKNGSVIETVWGFGYRFNPNALS